MNLFQAALNQKNVNRPPVWFMRQAGRYHSHYQKLRQKHSFLDLCKRPELACETTLGPIEDFDFDSAILFSDLLFPLEAMGMGLTYPEGPHLDWHLKSVKDLKKFQTGAHLVEKLNFQAEALRMIRASLPSEKGLIGFVGGPLTLYCYAVEGSHKGELESSKQGIQDGRFQGFVEKLFDVLLGNMLLQASAGADAVAVFDTCAGEFDSAIFGETIVPVLFELIKKFKEKHPNVPVIYYSKNTGPEHWKHLRTVPIQCLGIDWQHDLAHVISQWGQSWSIQGNIDPRWLFLDSYDLEQRLRKVFQSVKLLPAAMLKGWICGLGHGVLPNTPESNVRLFLKIQREIFN